MTTCTVTLCLEAAMQYPKVSPQCRNTILPSPGVFEFRSPLYDGHVCKSIDILGLKTSQNIVHLGGRMAVRVFQCSKSAALQTCWCCWQLQCVAHHCALVFCRHDKPAYNLRLEGDGVRLPSRSQRWHVPVHAFLGFDDPEYFCPL